MNKDLLKAMSPITAQSPQKKAVTGNVNRKENLGKNEKNFDRLWLDKGSD